MREKITIGVLNRVEQLADREEGFILSEGRPFESLVPLLEVIGASMGISPAGKKAVEKYEHMLKTLGPEFAILREIPVEDIRKEAGTLIAEGIGRLRQGQVERKPGFDGEYGKISLLSPEDISNLEGQMSFFTAEELRKLEREHRPKELSGEAIFRDDTAGTSKPGENGRQTEAVQWMKDTRQEKAVQQTESSRQAKDRPDTGSLNEQQQVAVEQRGRAVAVIAGPGAGKTKTLIARLHHLLEKRQVSPEEITAVTFTNKAAEEMRARMGGADAGQKQGRNVQKNAAEGTGLWIGTFHAICSRLLQKAGCIFMVADEGLQIEFAEKALREFEKKDSPGRFLRELSKIKNGLTQADEKNRRVYDFYQKQLREAGAMDYDDLLLETLKVLENLPEDAAERRRFSYLLIDEFQDINPLQYRLVMEWGKGGRELFVIGDPDQSIYGFRGCDPGVFSSLSREYPDFASVCLNENYRSGPDILQAALEVISHNEGESAEWRPDAKAVFPCGSWRQKTDGGSSLCGKGNYPADWRH